MKHIYIILALVLFISNENNVIAQTVWTGPMITFTKENSADWTLEASQDRITDNVWLTRANNSGLFNIVNEESTTGGTGTNGDPFPTDTEWAYGTTADFATLTYQGLSPLIGENFSDIVDGQDMVIHLITDNIFIDIKFLSWTSGSNGGGFSYQRSTDAAVSTTEFATPLSIALFPNPTSDFIQVTGITETENYIIYNILGAEIKSGTISKQDQIDLSNLTEGLYFLKLEAGSTMRFVKK